MWVLVQAKPGDIYQACRSKAKNGDETDIFETAEEAARAYDETALKKDNERAALNLSGEYDYVGQHVKDELYTLTGEDGISVIGVQAGVPSAVRLRLKFFSACCHYLEISLDKASSLPKMDTGLGSCDAYCIIYVGDYRFRTRIGMPIGPCASHPLHLPPPTKDLELTASSVQNSGHSHSPCILLMKYLAYDLIR